MATVNYYYRSQKQQGNLTLRFVHTKRIDLYTSLPIVIPKKSWEQKKQRIKNVGTMKQAGKLNEKLLTLEASIITEFSMSYMGGEIIDNDWLKGVINKFFNRPKFELEQKEIFESSNFFIPFCEKFIEEQMKTGKWKTKMKKPLSKTVIGQYEKTVERLKEYEDTLRSRLRIKDINVDFSNEYCDALKGDKKYAVNTINREITRIKFFCGRAFEEGLEVDQSYKNQNFSAPTEKTLDPYLNEEEIQKIIDLKIEDEWIDDIRDWFVIGLHTCFRISDFLGIRHENHPPLNSSFINGKYIQRTTHKTDEMVTIPIHSNVRTILDKRNGEFPPQISHKHFNEHIKDIAKDAGIDQEIYASVFQKKAKRKVKDYYKKYQAISSHICRRSFVTNNLNKFPRSVLMKMGGWTSESSFIRYIKKSGTEYADLVAQKWEEEQLVTDK